MIFAIDGFREADNIKEVSALGVDWIGLDFVAGSPREVRLKPTFTGAFPDKSSFGRVELRTGTALMGVFRDMMPQSVITRIYNYQLDIVRFDGAESPVELDNLRRTVDPDIRPGLKIMKTVRVERREDVGQAGRYADHVDYLLFDMAGAPWEWLADYEGNTPFLIADRRSADDAIWTAGCHHPQWAGYCLGSQLEQSVGRIDEAKVRQWMKKIPLCAQ